MPAELPEKVRPKLARLLGVEERELRTDGAHPRQAEIIADPEAPDDQPIARTVKVIGYVGAGNQPRVFYGNSQGDFDEVAAPEGSTGATVAVEVRGESLGLMFDRWLVFYDEVRRPVTSDLIGKLCVVGLPDESVLVKKIRKGRGGLYRLFSEREDPIENVEIEWAARVKHMAPR